MSKQFSINPQVVGLSVRGASHYRNNLPNQDSIGWIFSEEPEPYAIMVLSDGHGSSKSFRSQAGSSIAVEVTLDILIEIEEKYRKYPDLSLLKRFAEDKLAAKIVHNWQKLVLEDLTANPFSGNEIEMIAPKYFNSVGNDSNDAVFLIYGATLLAVLVTQTFIMYLQLGDGDILEVSKNNVVTSPIRKDTFYGNETTSLCSKNSWREIKLQFQPISGAHPALIMLSTDGYANSYSTQNDFYLTASDYKKIISEEGIEYIAQHLELWLNEVSESGSGDDISAGFISMA